MSFRKSFEIVKPRNCSRMSKEEMEYDGGFLNFFVAAVSTVASIGCSYMARKTGNSGWKCASYVLDGVSFVCSGGVSAAVRITAKASTRTGVSICSHLAGNRAVRTLNSFGTYNGAMTAGEYRTMERVYNIAGYPLDITSHII